MAKNEKEGNGSTFNGKDNPNLGSNFDANIIRAGTDVE
jgi:hypothetical protein